MKENNNLAENQEIIFKELPLPEESEEVAAQGMAQLCENLELILKGADLVMKRQEYFYIRHSWMHVGHTLRGAVYIPLGVLLELWQGGKWIGLCPDCSGNAYIYRAGGSLLSGTHYAQAMCPACQSSQCKVKGTVLYELLESATELCHRYRQQQKILRTRGPRFSWSKGLVGEAVPDKILEDVVRPASLVDLVEELKLRV